MSQEAITTEFRSNSSTLSVQGSDALNAAYRPEDKKVKVSIQGCGTETNIIKQLLNEFRGLHEQRLRCLQVDTNLTREELLQTKVLFLSSYVNDLTDQNQLLVETIDDLQKEPDDNVSIPSLKRHTSDRGSEVPGADPDELPGPAAQIPHRLGSLVRIPSDLGDRKMCLQTQDMVYNLEKELGEDPPQKQGAAVQVLESSERLLPLRRERSCLQQIQEDNLKEMAEKDVCITELQAHVRLLQQEGAPTHAQAQAKMESSGASFDRRLEEKEMSIGQLSDELNRLRQKLQTSDYMLSDVSERLDQTKTAQNTERQQREQIQEQLCHANKVMEGLQQELTHVRHTTEKKIQRREMKMCALLRELTESKKNHSECQNELLQRETAVEKLCEERDEVRAKMEDQGRECVDLSQTKEGLEADLALCHEKLCTSHLEVRSRDELILQLRDEMKTDQEKHLRTKEQVEALAGEVRNLKQKVRRHQGEACQLSGKVKVAEGLKDQKEKEQQQLHDQLCTSQQQVETFELKLKEQEAEVELLHQQLKEAIEEQKDANLQAQGLQESRTIYKQKYTAAIEKVHRVQGEMGVLQEELQYSQQQLRESCIASDSLKEELAEMVKRYQNKARQWENSQEAVEQLTDELQAGQNILRESQQKEDHFRGLIGSLQEQVDSLTQQKLISECDLRLYRQSHSHSDGEYHSLLRRRRQLQRSCSEQVERLAECEKAILQMKSELERQTQEKLSLKQSLVESHHKRTADRSKMEQEVLLLRKEITRLELELADDQKVHAALVKHLEEELTEARREAARRSERAEEQIGEIKRLQVESQKQEEELRGAIRQEQSLSRHVRHLSQELKELERKHGVTVEELAAHAEEARQMEERLNEGKLAEGKIRSMAVRLETEAAELKRNLQQAVHHKLKAEQEKQNAQDQMETLRSELEGTRSENSKLRHESQLVMTNVNHWITEQRASSESLTTQMKAHKKMQLIIAEEKKYLQEANDVLKAEVKRLKEVADEKTRYAQRFKSCLQAEIRERGAGKDDRAAEQQAHVTLNLSKMEDMQTRLRTNLEAIGMLNQQLNALSGENKWLRQQLEEERSMRLLPPPLASQERSAVHLPFVLGAHPPPSSSFSSLHLLPHPLSLDAATGDVDSIQIQAEQRWSKPTR